MTKSQHEELMTFLVEQFSKRDIELAMISGSVKAIAAGLDKMNGNVADLLKRVNRLEQSQAVDDYKGKRQGDFLRGIVFPLIVIILNAALVAKLLGG